jgi:hypothetical protein
MRRLVLISLIGAVVAGTTASIALLRTGQAPSGAGRPRAGAQTSSQSPHAAASPSGTPSATRSLAVSTDLEDGRYFGFIKNLDPDGSSPSLEFDVAQRFVGPAADEAAIEDGVIQPGEHIDNDAYVRNVNPRLRTLLITPGVAVEALRGGCCENHPETFSEFVARFQSGPDSRGFGSVESSWWITLQSGTVVRIQEQYVP